MTADPPPYSLVNTAYTLGCELSILCVLQEVKTIWSIIISHLGSKTAAITSHQPITHGAAGPRRRVSLQGGDNCGIRLKEMLSNQRQLL
jgi:hypothetical protein